MTMGEESVRFFCSQCEWSLVITAEHHELAYRRYWAHAQRHVAAPRIEHVVDGSNASEGPET